MEMLVSDIVAQKMWTMQECISYAVARNLTVKAQENAIRQQEISLSTARNSRLPNLSGGAGENVSFGRALTMDNTYANRNTQSTSFSLGTSVPLITGGQIPNEIKIRKLNLQIAMQECGKVRESVVLNVMSSFLETVYQKDLTQIARSQVSLSKMQAERLEKLYKTGKASEADVAQMRSTHASDQLALTQQENAYMMARLNLSQLLELESPEQFDVASPGDVSVEELTIPSAEMVYGEAVGIRPRILAEQTRLQSAERSIQLAKSAYFPSLHFNAGIGTSYYRTSGYNTARFGSQLRDNFNQYFGFSLSVPIFNRLATRNNVRSARVQLHTQEIQLEESKKALFKEIQQAYYNTLSAQRQCSRTDVALQYSRTAFELMSKKFENGKASATDFQASKTELAKAESNSLQARYTYLFRYKMLNFYRSMPQ